MKKYKLLIFLYLLFAAVKKAGMKEKYKYREYNLLEHMVDIAFVPFMELFTDGKDAHWWDWEHLDSKLIDKGVKLTAYSTAWSQKRRYIKLPIIGQYNPFGLWDLFLTLRVLPDTAIIEPENFIGEWSLIIKGIHSYGTEYSFIKYKFVQTGRVKTIVDGKKYYLGITKDGEYIPVRVVEVCPRDKYKDLLFV